jgi:hypothetical protein
VGSASKVIWCDRGWIPYHYGFCPDEAAWKRETKRLGAPLGDYPVADAMCTHLTDRKTEDNLTIVTVGHVKRPARIVITLLVHEAMHVWRQIREEIGEQTPSSEFEAYTMQNITLNLIEAYEATRGKLCRGV